jgi:5-formyltetrahydrofolate cyclo-ligase
MDSNASACLLSSTIATPDHDPDTAQPGVDRRNRETRPLTVGEVDKAGWRADLLARRRARGVQDVAQARRRIAAHLLPLAAPGVTICAYLPLATEPLDPDLPVATADSPLDWCEWGEGTTRRGSFGIEEPVGARLGSGAIESAQVVLVPALAVDRSGTRLGRGGGHYDRSLAQLATPASGPGQLRLIAVVFDDEIVDSLPREPFDRPVTEIATPHGGLRRPG